MDNTGAEWVSRRARLIAASIAAALVAGPAIAIASLNLVPDRIANAAVEIKFDACNYSGSGTSWTSNSGGYNATLVGSPTYSAAAGGSFVLNGSGQGVTIASNSTISLSTSSARTFQLWLKPTALPASGTNATLMTKYSPSNWDGYYSTILDSGHINLVTNGTGIQRIHTTNASPLTVGQWSLVTLVLQISSAANSTKIYIDNTNVLSTSHGTDGYSESAVLSILNGFTGNLGSYHAYDRALTDSEISAAHASFAARISSGSCVQAAPSVPEISSFTSSAASPTNSSSFTYSLAFSETVTGISSVDFSNAGSALGCSFDPGTDASSTSRTLTVSGCGSGTVRPRFAAGGATASAGGTGPASATNASTVITRDADGPVMANGSVEPDGRTVILNFDEIIGSTTAAASAFIVESSAVNIVPNSVSVSGSSVELTLPVNIGPAASARVSYTAPSANSSSGNAAIQDTLGNDAASFSQRNLTNNSSADATPPAASWTEPSSPSSSRTLSYTLTFSESVSGISAGDLQTFGSATGCTASPSSASASPSVTVTVSCATNGSVIVEIGANSVLDTASNAGPVSSVSSTPVNILATTNSSTASTTPTTAPGSVTTIAGSPGTTSPVTPSTKPMVTTPTSSTLPEVSAAGSTSTTTTVADLLPTTTLPPIDVPETSSGGATALIDGVEVDATITRENNAVLLKVGPLSARVWAVTVDGRKIPLDSDGRLRLSPGDSITLELSGFDVGSMVEIRLYSEPVLLGRVRIGDTGSLTGSFSIPSDVPAGDHRMVLAGESSGDSTTLAISLAVGDEAGGLNLLVILVPLALAILAALVLPVALSRRHGQPTEL